MRWPNLNLNFRPIVAGAKGIHGKDVLLDNDDIRPLKLKDRTWDSVDLSYLLVFGYRDRIELALIAIIITLNGRPGSTYHIGFPIVCRVSFGVYGAWWPVFNRAVMAIVWNGVNAVQGGECIYVMLHAIFPGIADIPNTMGSDSALTTAGMIGFVMFWLTTCAFLVIPVPKMRKLVYIKLIVFIISAVSMVAWCVTRAGGLGPIIRQPGRAQGSERRWLIVRFIMLNAANMATFASNAADFQRYAQKKNDVLAGNLLGFPLSNLLVALVGNLVCASSQRMFGELIWNPVSLLDRIQSSEYTPANRAGCFFIAACFTYSAIFSSIFENSIPAGNDIAALLPKYLNVRRGFFICAILSLAINPWYLLGSASIFVSFLASYQIFLSSITGVMLMNYYVITRGRIDIPDCFTSAKTGAYYYSRGWNVRAYIAYLIGVAPNFYGFLNNMGVSAPVAITRFYYFAYWVGLGLAALIFWVLCKIWPPVVIEDGWKEPMNYVRPQEEDGVILYATNPDPEQPGPHGHNGSKALL